MWSVSVNSRTCPLNPKFTEKVLLMKGDVTKELKRMVQTVNRYKTHLSYIKSTIPNWKVKIDCRVEQFLDIALQSKKSEYDMMKGLKNKKPTR